MACIKSAPRSALVSFSPDAPYFAAGTMAGAVDLSFSSSANLEIFELDFLSDAVEIPVIGACPTSERFNRISWGKAPDSAVEEFRLGLIAGGLGDGSIGVWNPVKLINPNNQDDPSVAELRKHTGPVCGLEFCAASPNLLASGADNGEVCVWDLANPSEPTLYPPLKGVGSGAQTEISYVSWNSKFQHILASTSHSGVTVVWDLRVQKPLTSLSDSSKRRCSVLQWNPDISTQLIVASDDDTSPSLRVWDVRKTISPMREFVGHSKGVIAMSWCPHDSIYLLTCAKDNRTICWDTSSGEIVCELPASTNWNFDVHWYPKIPGVISASSFDVKIGIYNIEACNRAIAVDGGFGAPAHKSPKWLKRPTGASFGFGGKIVSFHPQTPPQNTIPTKSDVYVHTLVTEQSLVSRSTEFETAIQNGERPSLWALCERKSEESISEDEKETWDFLKVMFGEEGTARSKLLAHLGFNVPSETDGISKSLLDSLSLDDAKKGTFMEDGDGSSFAIDNGEEFFNNPQPSSNIVKDEAISNGKQIEDEQKEPLDTPDSSIDDSIQRALVVGDYKGAVSQCISANRMADALVIANVGSPELWERTRELYLQKSLSPYLKVVSAMVNNDLMSLVNTRPLTSWKETLALLCTFAQKDEWTVLCDNLASRLMMVGNKLAATLCYICAGNIEKTVEIWSMSLKSDSEGRTYVDLLQELMEKTIVLALATGQRRLSPSLSKLVENYAELLASQGLLKTAMEYLKLLGSEELPHELAILQDRIASAAETEASSNLPNNAISQQPNVSADLGTSGYIDNSHNYYQRTIQAPSQQNVSGSQYVEGYQSSFGSYGRYQEAPQRPPFQEYVNPSVQPTPINPTFQPATSQMSPSFQTASSQMNSPFQPAPAQSSPPFQPAQMFIPSQSVPSQMPSVAPPPPTQSSVTSFVPQNPPVLRHAEQYQQSTLGSQLYPGYANMYQPVQPGQPAPSASLTGPKFQQGLPQTTPSRSFMPGPTNFVRPGANPAQPSSQNQAAPAAAPPPPPPTVQTVDTSNVSAELRPVIATLTRLYHETSDAFGGSNANPARKREIEDNSKKIGALFAKLNSGDISPNAASKLVQLCQALDSGDFPAALHLQVVLTTSDWDECNFWLAALKRMIKVKQNAR